MALVGKTNGYAVYVKQFERKKIWIEPNMSSNGTWMADGYSCMGSGLDSLNNLYQVFNGTYTDYLNKFNENTWIEICLPKATEVAGCYMTSSDGYLPATGDIYYSDDGNTYTRCGSWTDTSNSNNVTAYVTKGSGAHRIWRFMSTGRASAHTSSNADVSVAKLFTEVKEYLSVDNTLPEGAGGIFHAFMEYTQHEPLALHSIKAFYTYKQDDKINLWEGTDAPIASIKGNVEVFATYCPHDALHTSSPQISINHRPHDGVTLKELNIFIGYKQEDKVDSFKVPLGIGGSIQAYILQRLVSPVAYLNNIDAQKIQGIAIGSDYFPLKGIASINAINTANNTTTDT